MRDIDTIIVHCAATKPSMDVGVTEINRWHRQRGFWCAPAKVAIGYHYVIRRDGTLEKGRPIEYAGAHCSGHNTKSVGICLVGGIKEELGANGEQYPENNFTPEQFNTLEVTLLKLMKRYPIAFIFGHNQLANKACPCFDVSEWLNSRDIRNKKGTLIHDA